jgi:hypothetical protein
VLGELGELVLNIGDIGIFMKYHGVDPSVVATQSYIWRSGLVGVRDGGRNRAAAVREVVLA